MGRKDPNEFFPDPIVILDPLAFSSPREYTNNNPSAQTNADFTANADNGKYGWNKFSSFERLAN